MLGIYCMVQNILRQYSDEGLCERKNMFCTEKREIVNRTDILKHAVKKGMITLRVIVVPALLLSSRVTLMNVQAAGEVPVQPENIVEETLSEAASEEVGQEQTGDTVQAQSEVTAQEAQEQTGDAAQEQIGDVVQEPQEQLEGAEAEEPAKLLSVTMIGDSVMLGAAPSILGMIPDCVIDAKVSRQVIQADSVIDSLAQQNSLRQTVVIALGTNGPFSIAKGQELIDRLGSERTIYWVTAYGRDLSWQEESNATIRQLAEMNENVHIIDWAQSASGHAEWFCADGIHLIAAGRDAYANIILGGLSR